jgi:hypothetical protein
MRATVALREAIGREVIYKPIVIADFRRQLGAGSVCLGDLDSNHD